jgi:ribonuclease HI
MKDTHEGMELVIETDLKSTRDSLIRNRQKIEDEGYINTKNKELLQATLALMKQHRRKITIKWVNGHDGHEGNELADKLANKGANKAEEDEIQLTSDPKFTLTGAKLTKMTQTKAYRAIRMAEKRIR